MDQSLTPGRYRSIRSITGRDETFLAIDPVGRARQCKGTAGGDGQEADQVEAKETARVQGGGAESASKKAERCPAERW